MSTLYFKIWKVKSYFRPGKRLENLLTEKTPQLPRNLVIFSLNMQSKNNDFNTKNMKNTSSPK